MCLLAFAVGCHPDYPLIVVGNRDEYHHRPTEPMHWWQDPRLLAGRDLTAGGTWLGVTPSGRFATVTNYRDPELQRSDAISRGQLVVDALTAEDLGAFSTELEACGSRYNGFNLLWGGVECLYYYSNQEGGVRTVPAGIHGLSNGLLNTPWPKLIRVRDRLDTMVRGGEQPDSEALLDLLADRRLAADGSLPDTGIPKDWERLLSSPFIVSEAYGTRASTVVMVSADGAVAVRERSFGPSGDCLDDRAFRWQAPAP
ncbi:NRDE family protein [Aquisalimonas sp.]|uniref:NRDE family protein n=1 Tax=unclassified Aquisalimonas TaxID=2644645 RepID=UPI0025C48C7E|nr:NRDE family protein [Aquisalimonas sp.]